MKNKFLNSIYGSMAFLVLLVLIAAIPNPTFAATKGGVNSGSIFYTFDILLEKADLAFTFNKEKKVQKIVNNSEERLAEAETAANEGKSDIAEKAILKYQDGISSAFVEAKKINDVEKSKEILTGISDNVSKHQEILTSVYDSVPESAKESVEKAIAISVAGQEKIKEELEQVIVVSQAEDDSTKSQNKDEEEEIAETENQEEKEIEKTDNKLEGEESEEQEDQAEIKDDKKDEEKEEIEKLKKEIEELKVKTSQIKMTETKNKEAEYIKLLAEKPIAIENKQSSSSQTDTKDIIVLSQQPRLISYQDNFGNIYTEEKDFIRKVGEYFTHGFGASYIPLCMRISTTEDCQPEIVKWVNNRSIEIGKSLNVTLDSFDANDDDVFYYITYGSDKDLSYGNMRVLQSWETNKNFNIPITEQLYDETSSENLGWSSVFFDKDSRKYYQKNVKLDNAGRLNIQICFNDKAQKMDYLSGEQFTDGCVLFNYFVLKPGYSKLTTSTQSQ